MVADIAFSQPIAMRHSPNTSIAAGAMRVPEMWWSPPDSVRPWSVPTPWPCCGYASAAAYSSGRTVPEPAPYLSAGQVALTRALTELNRSLDFPKPNQIPNRIPNQIPNQIPNHVPNHNPNQISTYSEITARRGPHASLENSSCDSFPAVARRRRERPLSSATVGDSRAIVCDSSQPSDGKSRAKRSRKSQLESQQHRPAKRLAVSVARETNTCGSLNRAAQMTRVNLLSEATSHRVPPTASPVSSSTRIMLDWSLSSCHVSPSASSPSLPPSSCFPTNFPLKKKTLPPSTFTPFVPQNCRIPSFKQCKPIPPFTESFDLDPKSIRRPSMDGRVHVPLYERLTCSVQRKFTEMEEPAEGNTLDLDLHL